MAEYVRIITSAGATQYRNKTENKIVGAAQLEESLPALKEELDIAEPGTVIDSDTITQGVGDGVDTGEEQDQDDDDDKNAASDEADEAQDRIDRGRNPYDTKVPQTEKGFGFPRVDGKTVDIFDGETPHTHIRTVGDMLVPLNQKNYNEKTDAEIWDRLHELELV